MINRKIDQRLDEIREDHEIVNELRSDEKIMDELRTDKKIQAFQNVGVIYHYVINVLSLKLVVCSVLTWYKPTFRHNTLIPCLRCV